MNRKCSLCAVALAGAFWGCTGHRNAAQYSWLRKQGVCNPSGQDGAIPEGQPSQPATAHRSFPEPLIARPEDELTPIGDAPGDLTANVTGPAQFKHNPAEEPKLRYGPEEPQVQPAEHDSGYYVEQHHRWNAKAISALPVALATATLGFALQSSLLLLLGGAVAFTLGLIGSRQCRDREDRGKGFAIVGMALGGAMLFLGAIGILLGA